MSYAGTQETIAVGEIGVQFLIEPNQSDRAVSVFEFSVPAQARVPVPHSHDGFEETIYGLAGTTTWTVEGKVTEVAEGDVLSIPRGAVHGFVNNGSADSRLLGVATPGVFGPDYFREVGAVLAAAAGGPPDREAMIQVMRRHGLTPAPPQG